MGPFWKWKLRLLRPVDFRAGHVTRQQVRGELDAVESTLDTRRQGLDGAGLGQPGGALDQQVAVCQQGDDQSLYQMGLADDLAAEPVFQCSYICACHSFSTSFCWVPDLAGGRCWAPCREGCV